MVSSLGSLPVLSAAQTTPATFPVTPTPDECTVSPRPASDIRALLGTPAPTPTAPEEPQAHPPAIIGIPVGQPADRALQREITPVVSQLFACFNAGDTLRAFALATDDFIRSYATDGSVTAQDIDYLLAEPLPVPAGDRTTILAITDVSVLDGVRMGAFVITYDRFNSADTVYMILVQHKDRWLVDKVVDFL